MRVEGLEHFQDHRMAPKVQQVTRLLELEMGRSAERTVAEWKVGRDGRGRPSALLRVSDPTASLEATFTKEDLDRELRMESRKLIRFCGDFLQASSHKLLEPILESLRHHDVA